MYKFFLNIKNILLLVFGGFALMYFQTIIFTNINNTQEDLKKETSNKITNDESSNNPYTGCSRTEPYVLNSEFQRALSLIDQRMILNIAKSVYNCLYINYAEKDSDLNGAEGIFTFDPSKAETNKLVILVSPRYRNQSDLLTSFLLSHEIIHAWRYASTLAGLINADPNSKGYCYEDEALAFTNQWAFFVGINKGERDSLVALIQSKENDINNSLEIKTLEDLLVTIGNSTECHGLDYVQGTGCFKNVFYDLVTNDDFYQKQCENRI